MHAEKAEETGGREAEAERAGGEGEARGGTEAGGAAGAAGQADEAEG